MADRPRSPGRDGPPKDFPEVTPPGGGRTSEIVLVEIAKLQSDAAYLRRDVNEMRTDVREVRDRLAVLETKVDHLPSKGFIVGAVIAALTIGGAIITLAPKLQAMAGTPVAPPSVIATPSP